MTYVSPKYVPESCNSQSHSFFKKLNMIRNDCERLEDVYEDKTQLFMQSRICTANLVDIDPLLALSFPEIKLRLYLRQVHHKTSSRPSVVNIN